MKTFDSVAKLKLATLTAGQFVETGGYYTKGGGGAAKYLIVAPQAADGYGDHVLANGNVALLQVDGEIIPSQWGAQSVQIGALIGFDNSPVFQVIIDYLLNIGGGAIDLGIGGYYFASNVNIPSVNSGGLGQNGISFVGNGRKSTELFTDQDIDLFTHLDRLVVRDLSVVQRSASANKWKGVAFRSNGQSRFCIFENVEIWWFKFGNLQRFSLWNSYRDIYYVDNVCGIKLARSNDMENQTNPSPPGAWNASDGWFHNQNTFDNILFNGGKESSGGMGEVGFWGAVQGSAFNNITAQNYERTGSHVNVTIPLGQVSTCMEVVGGGPTSSATFNNTINDFYIERSFKGLKVDANRALTIDSWFQQGQTGGENLLEIDNSTINVRGQTGQSPGWANSIVANNSNVTFDAPIAASGAARILNNSYLSENSVPINPTIKTKQVTMSTGASGTITIDSSADTIAYTRQGQEVTVTGRVDVLSVSGLTGAFFNIDGLPFSAVNAAERGGNAAANITYFVAGGGAVSSVGGIILENATSIRVYFDGATVQAGDSMYISLTYLSDSTS